MLMRLSRVLTNRLFSHVEDEEKKLLCMYGFELWLYTIISTLGLILVGVVFRASIEAMIIITIFYICQSNGGGYHANTHLKCFLTMVCGLIIGIFMIKGLKDRLFLPLTGLLGMIMLLLNPLCLHQNKQYLSVRIKALKRRSVLCTIFISTVTLVLYALRVQLFSAMCMGMFLSSISRTIAAIQKKDICLKT